MQRLKTQVETHICWHVSYAFAADMLSNTAYSISVALTIMAPITKYQ